MEKRIKLDDEVADQKACVPIFVDFMEKLPAGITSNILSKLPLKSVMRCFSVKRSWSQMLPPIVYGSPGFGEQQLQNMEKDRETTGFFLLMKRRKISDHLETHLVEYHREVNSYQVTRIPSPFWASDFRRMEHKRIVGSVNGLVCLASRINLTTLDFDPVYVYNPMLRECLDLPPINNYSHTDSDIPNMAMGFGFHTTTIKETEISTLGVAFNKETEISTNHYKIVRVYYRQEVGEVEIYTLGGEGVWRPIVSTTYQLQFSKPGVHVAGTGKLYWLLLNNDDPPVYQIVFFDLETERFEQLPLPPDLPVPDADTSSHLNDLGNEKLGLTQINEGDIRIWIFMSGGGWIRIQELNLNTMGDFHRFRPYYLTKGVDEVLLSCATLTRQEVLAVSHFDGGDPVVVMRLKGKRKHDVIPHTRSLVSLRAMGGGMMANILD